MFHTKEFSKRAVDYQKNNQLQIKIAKKLISKIDIKPKRILDLGSGSGEVFREIEKMGLNYKRFIAVDFAKNMCTLHPQNSKTTILNYNFDDENLYKNLQNIDTIISSSSLQWSQNLKKTAKNIIKTAPNIYISIFTNNTFKTINQTANLKSFLLSPDEILEIFDDFESKIKGYKIFFENNILMFKYIKNSGVSGGVKRLSFKQTKELIKNYPLDYLEFEVIYLKKERKR